MFLPDAWPTIAHLRVGDPGPHLLRASQEPSSTSTQERGAAALNADRAGIHVATSSAVQCNHIQRPKRTCLAVCSGTQDLDDAASASAESPASAAAVASPFPLPAFFLAGAFLGFLAGLPSSA